MRIRLLAATLMAIAIAGVTASPAMAAPVATKSLCKSGGFAGYVDPATGAPFASQGRCVSFVNGGGVLTPVAVTPPPLVPTWTYVAVPNSSVGLCQFDFLLRGVEPGVHEEVISAIDDGIPYTIDRLTLVGADGVYETGLYTDNGTLVTVSVAGGTYTATTEC